MVSPWRRPRWHRSGPSQQAPAGPDRVRRYDTFTGALKFEFLAYDAAFHGGVRVAIGDINGDGVPDIVTTPGPGGGPHVRVFDGRDGTNLPGPGGNFFAYESTFTGGLFVACMETAANGQSQIVTMPDVGGGPLLKQFDNAGILVRAHYVYDPQSRRGANWPSAISTATVSATTSWPRGPALPPWCAS